MLARCVYGCRNVTKITFMGYQNVFSFNQNKFIFNELHFSDIKMHFLLQK